MTKTAAPRVRTQNLYTIEQDGRPVAQAMAISQAEAVRLYVESVQQPTMSARLSSAIEARTLAHLPLLQREPAAKDAATGDLFASQEEIAGMRATALEMDLSSAREMLDEHGSAAAEPLAAGGFAPCGRALGDCGKALQTCGRDGCGVDVVEMPPQHAPIAAVLDGLSSGADVPQAGSCNLPAEFVAYLDGEVAAAQPGEPAGCLDAAPTAGESAGACLEGSQPDDGGRYLTETERAEYEAQGAARFARHHGGELKRQAEAHAARAGGKIVAKYRNPADGQTWTGRGLKPRWLVLAMDEGKALEDFLIDGAKND